MENYTIDKLVVTHNTKQRNSTEDSIPVQFKIDYSGCSLDELVTWATRKLTIDLNRACENMSADEVRENVNGQTFHARSIGKKVKSRSEKIAELEATFISSGLKPEKAKALATAAIDNPELIELTK